MMRDLIRTEIDHMIKILRRSGFRLDLGQPSSAMELANAQLTTGIDFDESLRALFSLTGGSDRRTCLAVQTDELTSCALASLHDSVAWWKEWLPYDQEIHDQFGQGEPGRDPRIQPDFFVHRRWLPFAEFNCWSTAVYFDADPTRSGNYGQIIAYQHDPEAVYYIAPNVLEFLRVSNERLASHAQELLFVDGRPSVFSPRIRVPVE